MANFYDVHRMSIERDFNMVRHTGAIFNIYVEEPMPPPTEVAPVDDVVFIVAFRILPGGRYEPVSIADRNVIADWNERHKKTPESAWDLPDLGQLSGPHRPEGD